MDIIHIYGISALTIITFVVLMLTWKPLIYITHYGTTKFKRYCIDCQYYKNQRCEHKTNVIRAYEPTPIRDNMTKTYKQKPEEKNHDNMCNCYEHYLWGGD